MTELRELDRSTEQPAPLDVSGIRDWLFEAGLAGITIGEVLQEFCDRFRAAGFDMARAGVGVSTLHPVYGSYSFTWRPGQDAVDERAWEHEAADQPLYLDSPIEYMIANQQPLLRRRIDVDGDLSFPILEDLRAEGMTEYAAQIVRFGAGPVDKRTRGVFLSCATDRPGGFIDTHLGQMGEMLLLLSLVLKSRGTYDVATGVLETYLGRDAGHRVLDGEIRRGYGETIRAVLWLCDLREFTALADVVSRELVVEVLNDYLECFAGPVQAHGGQILKFMGDGFLATFELGRERDERVCRTALAAAAQVRQDVGRLNEARVATGQPVLDFGLALHLGDVMYGNIGAIDRLDFTVVGPAVNEVSRIQSLCRPLEQDILISRTFYDVACECHGQLKSLGAHRLRGVHDPKELFALES